MVTNQGIPLTLAQAISQATTGQVIGFGSDITAINLSSPLPNLQPGVAISAACANPVVITGSPGSVFPLNGNDIIQGLQLVHFQLKTTSPGNVLRCSKVQS